MAPSSHGWFAWAFSGSVDVISLNTAPGVSCYCVLKKTTSWSNPKKTDVNTLWSYIYIYIYIVIIHTFKRYILSPFIFSFFWGLPGFQRNFNPDAWIFYSPSSNPPKQSRNIPDAHNTKSPMKIAQLRGQPFLTLSSCKGFFGNPHNSNHTNSKPKQQNTSTTRMLLTSMQLVGGSIFVEKEKPTFTWKCIPTHGSNWEVKVFLLQVTYSIIFHLIPASLICCALWPPRGRVWFASPKWIMVRWLEPRDR